MERIDISKLDSLPDGKGRAGRCYILDDDYLIKNYSLLNEFLINYEEEQISKFVGYSNSTYIYPEDAYFSNGYLKQAKLEYIKERSLFRKEHNVLISDLVDAIDEMYEDLIKISDDNIYTRDIHDGNVILKDKKLYLIDRDEDVKDKLNSDFCLRENLFNINKCLFRYVLSDYHRIISTSYDMINNDRGLKLITKELLNGSSKAFLLKEFLYEYREAICKRYKCEVDKISDIHRKLVRR